MSSASAQTISINLLEQTNSDQTVFTTLLNWAITYGRYILIATEAIVLLAFISRFSLDRKLVDLREEISQKKIILEANQNFEQEYKTLQNKLTLVKSLLDNQLDIYELLLKIEAIIPEDTYILEFSLSEKNIKFTAISGSPEGLSIVFQRLNQQQLFSSLELSNIRKIPMKGIEFQVEGMLR